MTVEDLQPAAKDLALSTLQSRDRFVLLASTRRVGWVAMLVAAVLLVSSPLPWMRWLSVAVLALFAGAELWLRKSRPVLELSTTGYRVEVRGVVRFEVPWSSVRHALHDESEQALYLDCGERKRNLLLPPQAGFSFTFSDRATLYAKLLSALRTYSIPIENVARLELPRLATIEDPAKPADPGAPDTSPSKAENADDKSRSL